MSDVQALVERVREAIWDERTPTVKDSASAALDALTAALERAERELEVVTRERNDCLRVQLGDITRAQKAERERDHWIVETKKADRLVQAAEARAQKAEESARKFAAEAFSWQDAAQKAEAVVEAARQLRNEGWFAPWSDHAAVQVILAALDEQPTRLGGIEGKHYAVGGRDAPPPVDEQEQA